MCVLHAVFLMHVMNSRGGLLSAQVKRGQHKWPSFNHLDLDSLKKGVSRFLPAQTDANCMVAELVCHAQDKRA